MITSTSNQHIKEIRKLRDKKWRSETGNYLIEGTRIVLEALENPTQLVELLICKELLHTEGGLKAEDLAEKSNVTILEVNSEVFASLSNKDGPQGLAAVVKQNWTPLIIDKPLFGLWIALYEVADPGNLGTIIRTLDGVGGQGIFLIDNCTDPYDPSAIRASMGTIFSKKLIRIKSKRFIDYVRQMEAKVIGTSDSSKVLYKKERYPIDMILLMGSEREGLPNALAEICETVVAIPMAGKADSLNLAVATSIMLYEIYNQNHTN